MDEISISLPREREFGAVAGLVLGGVAARHDLTLDVLDDVKLAIESLLEQDDPGDDISIVLRIEPGALEATVGPFRREAVAELHEEAGEGIGLRRLLDTVVDRVSVSQRDGASFVQLRKDYALAVAKGE